MSEWIAIENRLPLGGDDVICFDDEVVMSAVYVENYPISQDRTKTGFCLDFEHNEFLDGVTHWMPMPSPPNHSQHKCIKEGCKNLTTICDDCHRVINTIQFNKHI